MAFNPFEHLMPWAPAPLRTSARTYAQFLTGALGAGAATVARRLQEVYAISSQLAGRIANAAAAYGSRIASAFRRGGTGFVPRAEIPRNPGLPLAYRVVANVRLRDPDAPPGSRDPVYTTWRTVVLDFTFNPTADDILKSARNLMDDVIAPAYSGTDKDVAGWRIMGTEIITLERRT